jgi:hypothetical protein
MVLNRRIIIFALPAVVYLLSGCVVAPSSKTSASFIDQAQKIRTVVLIPSEIKVYQIDAGGVREEIQAWSAQARDNLVIAVQDELSTRLNAAVRMADEKSVPEERLLLQQTACLYDTVAAMILLHTYPNPNLVGYIFDEKLKNFDYSLGSEVHNLAKEAEALLLVNAQDHVWTGGRQALQALGIVLGIGAGVATGVFIVPQMSGGTALRAALVDGRTGDILWFNAVGAGSGTDLRDYASATQMVRELFKDFLGSDDRETTQDMSR